MHSLHGIQISRHDHDEVAGHGLRSDQCSRASLALAGDGILALLQSSKQALLRLRAQGVYLVYEENSLVRLMNGPAFHPLVGWRLQASGLEGIMADISQEGAGVCPGGIHIRCLLLAVIVHQELGDHGILFGQHIAQ